MLQPQRAISGLIAVDECPTPSIITWSHLECSVV
jgi:hypothetical protein